MSSQPASSDDSHLPLAGTGRFWVYILTNERHTVLYIGVTNNLERRHQQHLTNQSAFTRRYNVGKLIYCENFPTPREAISREKQLKRWTRAKKEKLIAATNPRWKDISVSLVPHNCD